MLLSVTSYYSLLNGVLSPNVICKKAKKLGYTHVAFTDLNSLMGLPKLIQNCRLNDLKPVVASKIDDFDGFSCTVYVSEKRGFKNLCQLISQRHNLTNFSLVKQLPGLKSGGGVIITSNNKELISSIKDKVSIFYRIESLHKPSFYNEIQSLIIPDAAFVSKDDYKLHKLVTAIKSKTVLSRLQKDNFFSKDSIITDWKSIASAYAVFGKDITFTESVFSKISYFPEFQSPSMPKLKASGKNKTDQSAITTLKTRCYEGALKRYGEINSSVKARLEKELALIEKKGFSSYFLIVKDIVSRSPRTCGRGSGAASCVAYCLGITNVDPIRYNLMFERFLNDKRKDPPDIDIDFAWDERDNVLSYVFEKYGASHAAMVSNHLTFQPRMAIRETARVFGMTENEISTVTSRIPFMYNYNKQTRFINLINSPDKPEIPLDDPWPDILNLAQQIIGFPRGLSTHCGGVIITPDSLNNHVPTQPSAKGVNIIQWEKDGAEEMGLVKIDLLGNRSLAVIRDAINGLKAEGHILNENNWDPQSDSKTSKLLSEGKTMGVFYVESPAMRLLQKKTRCGTFEGLTINSSIIRPAANKFINEYIRRFHGGKYKSDPPILDEVLKETFGIMVYQEDISRVVSAVAGFPLADAEQFRKDITKNHRSEKSQKWKSVFKERCLSRGYSPTSINNIWEMFLSFTGYSFAKPHSASYVQVSFQAAWLKAHFSAHFMAAVIGNYGGFYSTQAYINEALRLGLLIHGTDINISKKGYFAKKNTIYVGLCQIKGLTESSQKTILKERKKGRFESIKELLDRTSIKEEDAEKLIVSGACDSLENDTRPVQFWKMRSWYCDNYGGIIPKLKPFKAIDILKMEYRSLGFLVNFHPITLLNRKRFPGTIRLNQVKNYKGSNVTFIGWCITSKTVMTVDGMPMKFVTFEDETDLCETVMFPNSYKKFVYLLEYHTAFIVTGKVMEDFGVISVEVKNISSVNF